MFSGLQVLKPGLGGSPSRSTGLHGVTGFFGTISLKALSGCFDTREHLEEEMLPDLRPSQNS